VTIEEQYDLSDVEALEALTGSHGWVLLERRITAIVERTRRALENESSAKQSNKLRGQLYAYRVVLDLPSILAAEISQQVKIRS